MKRHLLKLNPRDFCKETFACSEGVKFAIKFKTMREVWDNCKRPDWMFWILNEIDAPKDDKALRLYAVWCARSTPLRDGRVTGDLITDPRSLNALVVAERFANGQATQEQLAAARDAARAALEDAVWGVAGAAAQGAAVSAAQDAARAAARAAAEDAVWHEGRDAARDAQANQLRLVVRNPFK